MVDIEIGEIRKNKKMNDVELMEKYRKEYNLEEDYQIIFTDGSVQEGKKSTGVGIVFDEAEIAYTISIDKRCSVYTAEAVAIKKAIGVIQDMNLRKDVLILIDSQSVCKALKNNDIKRFQNRYICKIRERIYEFINRNRAISKEEKWRR